MSHITNKTKLWIAISIFLWSSAFVAIRAGLQGYSPEGLALLRFIIASICMVVIYFCLGKRSYPHWRDIIAMLLCGVIGVGFYNIALNHGEVVTSAGMTSFLIGLSPLVTVLFAVIFLNEKLNLLGVFGFFLSVLGVALIAIGEQGGFSWDTSLTYILIATLCSGFYSFAQKPFVKKYHAMEVTAYFIWGGTLFLCLYHAELVNDLKDVKFEPTLMSVYLGIFPGAVGLISWSYVLKEISAARASSFLYLMPFVATTLGWLYLGEVPVLLALLGGLLAVCGAWTVNQSYRRPPVVYPES